MICQSIVIINDPNVKLIAATHVKVEGGMLPRRIVCYERNDHTIVVHSETMYVTLSPGLSEVNFLHHSYDHGNYFIYEKSSERDAAMTKAIKCWEERAGRL